MHVVALYFMKLTGRCFFRMYTEHLPDGSYILGSLGTIFTMCRYKRNMTDQVVTTMNAQLKDWRLARKMQTQ